MGRVMKGIEKTVTVKGSQEPLETIAIRPGRELRVYDKGDRIEIRVFRKEGRAGQPTKRGFFLTLEQFAALVNVLAEVKIHLIKTKRLDEVKQQPTVTKDDMVKAIAAEGLEAVLRVNR